MTGHRAPPPPRHVSIEAWQRNGRVFLDHFVRDEYVPGVRTRQTQRRVIIDVIEPLSHQQLTALAAKMCNFVLAKIGPGHGVPEGLSYQEVGLPPVRPVPPARGGRGGHNPVEESAVRPIPEDQNPLYHQSTPSSLGAERVARNDPSALDLPGGWYEVPLWDDLPLA